MFKFNLDDGALEFIDHSTCNSFIATAVIGAGVLGAGATIYGSSKAADAQEQAAQTAANTSLSMYNTTRGDLAPYRDIGNTAATDLTTKLSDLTSPITMDESTVKATPGYQFNLTQGLKATQNSAAARGLGTSGAALKGAATFATGLADNTYQNQFSNANTNQTNAFQRLSSLVNTGENAAAQTGTAGTAAANTAAGAQIGAGNAAAAADNSIGSSVTSAANAFGNYAAYKGIYGSTPSVGGAPLNAPSVFSDVNLKDDIDKVGKLKDGTPVFSYYYKNDPLKVKHIGLMAQDIINRRPDAVHKTKSGFLAVDYEKATERSRKLSSLVG
jgi:hypothetical protein